MNVKLLLFHLPVNGCEILYISTYPVHSFLSCGVYQGADLFIVYLSDLDMLKKNRWSDQVGKVFIAH